MNNRLKEITENVYRFHTKKAPGIPIGVVMVDYAMELLGEVKGKINAVSETQVCLSDVLQVMTGCTIGNKYLRVLPGLGRYALTIFDRDDGHGVRVYVDLNKIDPAKTPELFKFFGRKRDPEVQKGGSAREESGRIIIQEFETVERGILSWQRVQLENYGKPPTLGAEKCSGCGETYLQRDHQHLKCDFCLGQQSYYRVVK